MAAFASSYMKSAGGSVTRIKDQLNWTWNARPQAMTFYVRFYEAGTILRSANTRILSLARNTGARFNISVAAGPAYRATYHNGTTGVNSTTASAPSMGDLVELRATLAADGSVRIHQSINGGAEASASASSAQVLPQAWNDAELWLNSAQSIRVGAIKLTHVAIHRGAQTRATMRRLAGV